MEDFSLEYVQKLTRENSAWYKKVEYIKEEIITYAKEGHNSLSINVDDLDHDNICRIKDYLHKFNPEYNQYTYQLSFSW